jgi:hypothetical protein
MIGHKFFRSVLLFIMLVVLTVPSASVLADRPAAQGVQITPIGHPSWKPVDFHLFSAPIGTGADGYAEFFDIMGLILPPPNHVHFDSLGPGGIGPGTPHNPPYNTEIAKGVARLKYHQGVEFRPSEFSNGVGVTISWMTVPNPGVTGSSPDFARGPVIPNTLFPIHILGVSYHNNALFDPYLVDVSVPNLAGIDPKFTGLTGHSHFPMWVADSIDFGPAGSKITGSYTYSMDMTDVTGNGWHVAVHFSIDN